MNDDRASENKDPLEDEFKELCEQYRKTIPEKSASIQQTIDEIILCYGKKQTPEFKPLEKLVHKLSGSSGSYGFHILSDLSRVLEHLIADGKIQRLSNEESISFLRFWYALFSEQARLVALGKKSTLPSEKIIALIQNKIDSTSKTEKAA